MKARELSFLAGLSLTCCVLVPAALAQDFAQTSEQFFAGTVVEHSAEQLTVARTLQGRSESRIFKITADTKVEGNLTANARVTVGYDGDRATLIIVRDDSKDKK